MAVMPETVSLETAHKAAHEGAVFVDRSDLGVLKITGETRLDLIHRMSTQAVNNLKKGEGAATILTTDIGRIIDRLLLYAGSDTVYMVTGENNADNIARYLLRFVFFNDDFHLEDLSAKTAILAVYGAQAAEKLRPLFGQAVELPLHHWHQLTLDGLTVYLHRTDPVAGAGYFVMGSVEDKEAVWEQLVKAGITPVDQEAFDYLRIESGRPRFGREITNEYIPLETGLWDDVSFSKGCYTGQEIIARMESRGRLAKQLMRLYPEGPVQPGDEIRMGGRSVGTVTSAISGPERTAALGYIRTKALDGSENEPFTVGDVTLHPVVQSSR